MGRCDSGPDVTRHSWPGGDTYITIPTAMQGVTYIKTANNDKSATDPAFLSFDVNTPVTVYVAYDQRIATKPTWLTSAFSNTGLSCATSDTTFEVYAKDFPAGTVTLGGNTGAGYSMYTVVIAEGTVSLPQQ